MPNIANWLENIGLSQYVDLFAQNDIDLDVLPDLTEEELEKLGVSLGHRKKLLRALAADDRFWSAHAKRASEAERLSASARVRPERRHLTVMFCDLVGSTALSAQLDPEDLREILHSFQRCCTESIRLYGGHIARFFGDGVLAYFGFPKAREGDAEGAVNAALKIVELVTAIRMARRLEVRIGIATGLVVAGDLIGRGSAAEFALVGEAPNLAARLQALAAPNQILLATGTRRLLGRSFELLDLGNQDIRGLNQPVRVWLVVGPNPVASRFDARQTSTLNALIGRGLELALLNDKYDQASCGRGQLLLVSGEPGIGKSRLIVSLREQLVAVPYRLISLQCSAYHTNTAWYPVIRYLERAAEIMPDEPSAKLDKLRAFLDQLSQQSAETISLFASLLSIPTGDRYPPLALTPSQQKRETFNALLALLENQTKQMPAILVFEDVHWIDPTSLELLMLIRDHVARWKMLAILLFRPELNLGWSRLPHITNIVVNRLDPEHVTVMIQSIAEDVSLPQAVMNEIVAKSDGVPLFIEEMTKAVLEFKATREVELLADFRSSITVPDTLHESLMARLDQVAPMKSVAQIAAVLGREFSLELLQAIASQSEDDVRAAIERLLGAGLVFRSSDAGEQSFTFKHALVRDEAYASLLRDERRRLHRRAADALRADVLRSGRAAPEVVAHHFTEAGEPHLAIDYWVKAAHQAEERFAFVEAGTHLRTALNQLTELPPSQQRDERELRLQYSLGNALYVARGVSAPETGQTFRRALELCRKFEGSPQTTMVLDGIAAFHNNRDEFEQARQIGEELLLRGNRDGDATQRLIGHRALGTSLFLIGEFNAAREQLLNLLELYEASGRGSATAAFAPHMRVASQALLALASVLLGDVGGGLAFGRAAVAEAERLRHPHSICCALDFLAGAHALCRTPEAAFPIAERAIGLAGEHAFPVWLAGGHMLRGWARVELGEVDAGLVELHQSIDALEATGALTWVRFARYLLAQSCAKAGRCGNALEVIDQTLVEISGTSGRWYEGDLSRLRGDLLLCSGGPPATAEACYETAIAIAQRQGARLLQLRATKALAEFWRARGGHGEVYTRLATLYSSFGPEAACADLREAEALLLKTAGTPRAYPAGG
jgi:class 3 adenylate cyclase/tetratricopeptide (TPR) repeat protein